MVEQNPTVIIAHLNDEKLRKSIDDLVGYVDEKFKAMTTSTTSAVSTMQKELQKLGSLNTQGAGGGELGITKALQRAKQEAKESSVNFDQMAASMQKATTGNGNKTIFSTMDTEISILKERLVEAKSQVESFTIMARRGAETGDKGLFVFSTENLHKYEAEVTTLTQKINSLTSQRQALKEMLNPQGDAFKNYVDSLTKANPDLAALNAQYKDGKSLLQQQTNEVKRRNQEEQEGIRSAKERAVAQERYSQQLREASAQEKASQKERAVAAMETAKALREAMKAQKDDNIANNTQKSIAGVRELHDVINQMHRTYLKMSEEEKASPIGKSLQQDILLSRQALQEYEKYNRALLGMASRDPIANRDKVDSYTMLSNRVRQLTKEYHAMSTAERDSAKGKGVVEKIQLFSRAMSEIQKQMNRPTSLKNALGLDENTLDRIAHKIQQLNSYRSGLNIIDQKQVGEMRTVENEIDRLKKKQDELMGKNQKLMNSNNALARSWNYMKNRLAFYFTVGASTQFVKNLIEVRSQYEMNERALGILIDSAERGTQIFNELSQMALVSPYTLIELSTAAKQLSAYDVAAKDVVDTTRRLADISAAVGVPVERFTYALGQVKAFGHLTSQDARQFLNTGVPLVKELAKHYTELEGRLVSTSDVYERMKKHAVSYNDVLTVLNKMTDEGGKFFDFQAKMADTLKVQLANLTLAWNNMLNEIGKSEQGVLVGGIKGLKELFLQWENINKLVRNLAITFGFAKLAQVIQIATLGMDAFGKKMVWQILVGKKLQVVLYNIAGTLKAIVSSPLTWWALLATAVTSVAMAFYDADKAIKGLNKSIIDGANERVESINKVLATLGSQYNFEEFAPAEHTLSSDVSKDEAKKIWETIREEIEMSSSSAQEFINKLENIDDINVRVGKGFDYLKDIQKAQAALSQLDIKDIDVEQDMAGWYNLYALQDGLIENFRDMQKEAGRAEKDWKDYAIRAVQGFHWGGGLGAIIGGIGIKGNDGEHLKRYQEDLQTTVDSIIASMKKYNVEGANVQREFFATSMDKILQDTDLTEKERLKIRIDAQELFYQSEVNSRQQAIAKETGDYKNALQQELNDFIHFHEQRNGYTLGFEKWLQKTQITMLTETFGKMSAKELKQIDFSKGEWGKWAYEISKKFAEQNNLAIDDVFANLRKYLSQDFTLYIKTVLQKPDDKSVYDTLTEADKAADEALAKIQRLKTRKGELESKGAIVAGTRDIDTDYANTIQEITDAQKDYNDALAKGGHSKKENTSNTKAQKQAETELQKALKDELSLLDKVRSQYNKLTDAGVDGTTALNMVTNQFTNSIQRINNILGRNGLPLFNIKAFAGTDNPNAVLEMLKKQLDAAKVAKNIKPEEIKELEVKYGEIVIDAKVYNTKKITDGLNNELSKIKDEYELAVELDANPELGVAFADLFGINTDELPQTFGEAFDRANKVAKEKLSELKIDVKDFDLLSTRIQGDDNGMWMGHKLDSEPIQKLIAKQKEWRDMLKKNLTETEKALDDYVKKYGDYSDKIAEIEADRIEKVKRLNDAYYSEELRKRPEYIAKLNAIEQGAAREKQQVDFDDFKNSRYYTQMFENLDHVSSVTIRAMRDRLRDLIDNMNDLTPEQLKQVMQQYEKLEQKLTKRNPFRNLTKDLKEYIKTSKQRRTANKAWADADKEYNAQKKVVATIKEKLEKEKAKGGTNKANYLLLLEELGIQQEILDTLKQEVDEAEKKAQKYNLIKKFALEEASVAAQMVAGNLTSLGELRDTLDGFGINLGDDLDAIIDDLGKVGEGINQITSSATSGNVVGIVSGVVKSVGGLGDSIASIFGGGAAKTKRLNREIARSQESVRQLQYAYQRLEREVSKATGTQETWAKRQQIANKEEEMKELQRQMQLEQSKRSKDRDDEAIKQYKETIDGLWYEIQDLKEQIANDLLGSDVKSAAQEFVDTWVDAWKQGETTLDAVTSKMDEMIMELIKRAASSAIVQRLLQPLYSKVDKITSEDSEGGVKVTMNEIKALADLSQQVGVNINDALGAFYGQLEQIGAVSKDLDAQKQLSSLQNGIQSVTEETAGALESYMNGISQQVYLQSDLLTQIRDAVVTMDNDVQIATQAQILLQLQQSFAVHMAIQNILEGVLNPSGRAFNVELLS